MNSFEQKTVGSGQGLWSRSVETIQVNVGLRCNQRCLHCHVQASPERPELMDRPTMELVVTAAEAFGAGTVDITGGAPELNPHLRHFIEALRGIGRHVQVRSNLTALLEKGSETLPEFFRSHEVALVGSMPCYLEENVDAQRGSGAYQRSIEAVRRLNALGYGKEEHLPLNLVYNPAGPYLPPEQGKLEEDYRGQLKESHGLFFTRLWTLTNMPIGRFAGELRLQNREEEYMELLIDSFNPETMDNLMCRHQISVAWDGTLFDCDFNLALGIPVNHGAPDHISCIDVPALKERRIMTGPYCFGCTAGCGSSCGGALA